MVGEGELLICNLLKNNYKANGCKLSAGLFNSVRAQYLVLII